MQYLPATVVANTELGEGHWLLQLKVPAPLPPVRAGQFLSLRCDPAEPHTLLRPFSILDFDADAGTLSVYYKHLGRLSTLLSDAGPGSQLDCLYPLGQGFPVDPDYGHIALVGGGTGLAPLLLLARQLSAADPSLRIHAYFGGASEADLVPALLKRYELSVHLATLDGSAGFAGTVVELFETGRRGLSELNDGQTPYDVVYACGPKPMLAALARVLPDGCAAFASLEEYMACGVGACLGCAARIREGDAVRHKTVCQEGPVFELRRVVFDG